jgi:hypothetical protein
MLVTMGGALPLFLVGYAMCAAFFGSCVAGRFGAKGLGCLSKKKHILWPKATSCGARFAQDDKLGGMRAEGSWRPPTTFVVKRRPEIFEKTPSFTVIWKKVVCVFLKFLRFSMG